MSKEILLSEFAPASSSHNRVEYQERFDATYGFETGHLHQDDIDKAAKAGLVIGGATLLTTGALLATAHPVEAKEVFEKAKFLAQTAESLKELNEKQLQSIFETWDTDDWGKFTVGVASAATAIVKESKESMNIRNLGQIASKGVAGFSFGYFCTNVTVDVIRDNNDYLKMVGEGSAALTAFLYVTKTSDPTRWFREKASKTVDGISRRHKNQDTVAHLRNIMEGHIPITGANFPNKEEFNLLQQYKQEYIQSDGTGKTEILDKLSRHYT